jgi:hypothetical protein
MPVSKKRKKSSGSATVQSRQKKQLYLPLKQDDADQMCLQARLSFEAMRQGRGDRAAALNMCSIALMCETITVAGHGLLPLSVVAQATQGAFDALDDGVDNGVWQFSDSLVEELTLVINEYDRQMRESRLQTIIAAAEKVERFLVNRARVRASEEVGDDTSDDV